MTKEPVPEQDPLEAASRLLDETRALLARAERAMRESLGANDRARTATNVRRQQEAGASEPEPSSAREAS